MTDITPNNCEACGSSEIVTHTYNTIAGAPFDYEVGRCWQVQCSRCGGDTLKNAYSTRESAIAVWNRLNPAPPDPHAKLTIPTIHLNGTSKESLILDLSEASIAIENAYQRLKQCAPNGRDYYVQPGSLDRAIDDHNKRLERLDAIGKELDYLIEKIEEQGK